jgi:hypothetical protein
MEEDILLLSDIWEINWQTSDFREFEPICIKLESIDEEEEDIEDPQYFWHTFVHETIGLGITPTPLQSSPS